jgi:hypothetical protein
MLMLQRLVCCAIGLGGFLLTTSRADELVNVASVKPFPAVAALAAREHLPLEGFDPVRDQQTLRLGDTITVLFTLEQAGLVAQWIAEIKVVPLTSAERSAKSSESVIYTSNDHEYRLTGAPAAFALRMFGPVSATDLPVTTVQEKTARFLVKEDFLRFGFDRLGDIVLRLRGVGQEIRLGVATGRFSEEQMRYGKRWAQEAGFTAEDELICVKQGFAQVEFLQIARLTPGFEDIVKATLDLPSIWSAVFKMNFGVWFSYDWKHVQRGPCGSFGLTTPVYSMPFGLTMFGQHVANGSWLVTSARPPFLASAGILGLVIVPPNKLGKRLEMRVIAARHGGPEHP